MRTDPYLLERVRIKENPTELDNLGRVLGNVDAVLITGGRHVDHDVAIDVELGNLLGRHDGGRGWESTTAEDGGF